MSSFSQAYRIAFPIRSVARMLMPLITVLTLFCITPRTVFSQGDGSASSNTPYSVSVLLMANSAANESDSYASGAASLGMGIQFLRSFQLWKARKSLDVQIGLRLTDTWFEHYPENIDVRINEQCMLLPLLFTQSSGLDGPVNASLSFGGYVGGLLSQNVRVKPGLTLWDSYAKSHSLFSYFKAGVAFDFSISFDMDDRRGVVVGVMFEADAAVFGESESMDFAVKQRKAGVHIGIRF